MQIPNDADHNAAFQLALDMVLADAQDPDANLSAIAESFITGAASAHEADVRQGLVCRYLTKIASQLAGVIKSASTETYELWVKEMRGLTQAD